MKKLSEQIDRYLSLKVSYGSALLPTKLTMTGALDKLVRSVYVLPYKKQFIAPPPPL